MEKEGELFAHPVPRCRCPSPDHLSSSRGDCLPDSVKIVVIVAANVVAWSHCEITVILSECMNRVSGLVSLRCTWTPEQCMRLPPRTHNSTPPHPRNSHEMWVPGSLRAHISGYPNPALVLRNSGKRLWRLFCVEQPNGKVPFSPYTST